MRSSVWKLELYEKAKTPKVHTPRGKVIQGYTRRQSFVCQKQREVVPASRATRNK
jgi:hypothetical protein